MSKYPVSGIVTRSTYLDVKDQKKERKLNFIALCVQERAPNVLQWDMNQVTLPKDYGINLKTKGAFVCDIPE